MSIFSPDGGTRRGELQPALAQFGALNPPRAESAGACAVCFRCRKNRSYGGKILFQSGEGVTIPGRGGVLRNLESARDLSESKFVPDLHHQHLPLFVRQEIERGNQGALRFVFDFEHWLDHLISFRNGRGFSASAPAVAPEKIKSNGANSRVKQAAVRDVVLFSPETDESFLDNVFRIGRRSRPLPRKQQQAGCELGKASLPVFISGDILHDLFTVFYNQDAAKFCFCLNPADFVLLWTAGVETTGSMNWIAIICAAAAYWIIGAIWYVALFGKIWAAGIEQHGVKLERSGMAAKMIGNFICNLVAAAIMARLIVRTGIVDVGHGLKLGAGVGLGFSATALTIQYLWESKPFKVWLIDSSYHFFGCIALGGILAVWR